MILMHPLMMVNPCHEAGGQAYYLITTTITKEGDLSTRVWALPLAFAMLGGGAPVSYHHHFYHHYLSQFDPW